MKQLFILFFCYFSAVVSAQSPLYIGSTLVPPLSNPEQSGLLDQLAHEAFTRIGYKIIISLLPSERSLINANKGIDDGDIARIDGLWKMYPNLIKVPEKIIDYEFVVLTKNKTMNIATWEDLTPYSVGLIAGWKILEKGARNASVISSVDNEEGLFSMLQKDRVDLIIYERREANYMIRKKNMNDVRMILPPLAIRKMYLYLNKRHHKLIPKLADALKQMKRDGTYDRITQDILSKQ